MYHRKRRLRVQDDPDVEILAENEEINNEKQGKENTGSSCNPQFITRVFSEDYQNIRGTILDPQSQTVCQWNKIFLAACLLSLFLDPLFFYSPYSPAELCVEPSDRTLDLGLAVFRSVLDVFYLINIVIQFRTAYVAPSSRVLGRGELVIDPWKIASRYFGRDFWIDLLALLPLPQVIVWAVIPNVTTSATSLSKTAPRFAILLQMLLRVVLIFPLQSKISEATGAMPKRAWTGATYNIILYYMFSNVAGASFYLLLVHRQAACWRSGCDEEGGTCKYMYFDCRSSGDPERSKWLASTNVRNTCNAFNNLYSFGIYEPALQFGALAASFSRKYFHCFWWALQNLSSLGNNLETSSNVVENIFTNLVATLGVVLFALLIGGVQTYTGSSTKRQDEWRIKRGDTERWMHHRQLNPSLRQAVRRYDQYKWVATRGVDEETLLRDLPLNLRRKVNRHLWFNLLRQAPLFEQMDDHTLDAICERLKPELFIEGAVILREGDPVTKMLFIIRGNLDSCTTSGGRAGFFNSLSLGPGNFCGEELLTWALDPHSHSTAALPASTRTVKSNTKVEALALTPQDLKYVASQYRKLHSRQVLHKFRFHSHQWRTWAACYIQAAWHRYKRRKELVVQGGLQTELSMPEETEIFLPQPGSGLSTYAAELVRRIRRGSSNRFGPDACTLCSSMDEYSVFL